MCRKSSDNLQYFPHPDRSPLESLRVFLSGDYEFLCKMYGISGASGIGNSICYTVAFTAPSRQRNSSLETLKADYGRFVASGALLKNAKHSLLPMSWILHLHSPVQCTSPAIAAQRGGRKTDSGSISTYLALTLQEDSPALDRIRIEARTQRQLLQDMVYHLPSNRGYLHLSTLESKDHRLGCTGQQRVQFLL